jgi:hypothetical protein
MGIVLVDQWVVEAVQAVHVAHHTGWAMHEGEMITKQLLGNPAYLVDITIIFKHFSEGNAVAYPIKVYSP